MTKIKITTIKQAMNIIADLQKVCRKQREEIKSLKNLHMGDCGEEPPFDFSSLFNNFNGK